MNISKYTFLALTLAIIPSLSSCVSDGDETFVVTPGTEQPAVATRVVSSSEGAVINSGGYTVTVPAGAVPRTESGSDGRVAFSISPVNELPSELPSGATSTGSAVKIEPMGFTFETPIVISIPAPGVNPANAVLLYYNENTGLWESVPFTQNGGNIEASVLELGTYVLVTYDSELDYGGIHIASRYLDPEFYYYVTLISNNSYETKRIGFAPNGQDLYMAGVPLGQYGVVVSRIMRSDVTSAPDRMEFGDLSVNVITHLVPGNGGLQSFTGWTEIALDKIYWNDGRYSGWGDPTVTYGTGTFQATLTWVNPTSGNYTDYDLHLFGPDNLHVYFENENQGAFELDRDWISEPGNAIENIYSVSDNITPGLYNVKVNLYSGVENRRYNCRVILNGVVVKSVSGSISREDTMDDICSFEIQ